MSELVELSLCDLEFCQEAASEKEMEGLEKKTEDEVKIPAAENKQDGGGKRKGEERTGAEAKRERRKFGQVGQEVTGEAGDDIEVEDEVEVEDEADGGEMPEPVQVEGFFICHHCHIVMKPVKEAKHVMQNHKITCSIRGCARTFLKQSDQLHHLLAHHDDPQMVTSQGFFYCSKCNKVYEPKDKKRYNKHLKFGKHFVCEKDDRQFSKASQAVAFEYHRRLEHRRCVAQPNVVIGKGEYMEDEDIQN